ncbi:hypothetical protein EZS27_014175 [termite gut metagenome]|uniref:Uncharacterized protein n=1 Tax=termite gut metagenome TaxID=433724 RepID=A0A5J4RWF2_9ZZZZ
MIQALTRLSKMPMYHFNGIFREQMQWLDESFYGGGIYISHYKPQTGDIIRIEAATKYGETWVEETVPTRVQIEDVTFSHKLIYDHTGYGLDKNGNLVEIPLCARKGCVVNICLSAD